MGRPVEQYPADLERLRDGLYIADLEVDDGARMVELRPLRQGQHQPDTAAVEECHLWPRLKKKAQAQRVAIERYGPIEVVYVDGELTNPGRRKIRVGICHIRSCWSFMPVQTASKSCFF